MKKVLLILFIALAMSFGVMAQATTQTEDVLVAAGIGNVVLYAPYVKDDNAAALNAKNCHFFYKGKTVVVMCDSKVAGVGTLFSALHGQDLYAVGREVTQIDVTKINFEQWRKPAQTEQPQEVKLDAASFQAAQDYFKVKGTVADGSLQRLADMGLFLNERALVIQSEDPKVEYDLKGKDLKNLAQSFTISNLEKEGVKIVMEYLDKTETWTLVPNVQATFTSVPKKVKK